MKQHSSTRKSPSAKRNALEHSSQRQHPQARQRYRRQRVLLRVGVLSIIGFGLGAGFGTVLAITQQLLGGDRAPGNSLTKHLPSSQDGQNSGIAIAANGRPALTPLPEAKEVWTCEVIVIGGSLGGVAAAAHAMESKATTCLIELTPWLGGQISSQGVSALDESHTTWLDQGFSKSWNDFKDVISQQPVQLPAWSHAAKGKDVADLNSCWVGRLCFSPRSGASAALQLLKSAATKAPSSKWGTSIAFKGAEFDATGKDITAVYAVRRSPRQPGYTPQGRPSAELTSWYSWSGDDTFEKTPLRLQAPPGKRLIVIDATDTGEFVGWANVPHRLGAESLATTGEPNASRQQDNADCTQAFTFPFALGIHDDRKTSLTALSQLKSVYAQHEHEQQYDMDGFSVFEGKGFFNYRRIVSTTQNDPFSASPAPGDITIVNWNRGNDWTWMNPPLIMGDKQLDESGQRHNWMGGQSTIALKHAENHALLFAQWLLTHKTEPGYPLSFLSGAAMPLGTSSGLSMVPYIREGRRIIGRRAYGQREFALREADIRLGLQGARDFSATSVAVAHYAIDIHGCRYRNWEPSGEAMSAPALESKVRPAQIPLESLIPIGVNNLLIGGKGIAVTHIVNAVTRTHYSEWSIGAAAGATAGWLVTQEPTVTPPEIVPKRLMPKLQRYLTDQGLRLHW